ncbi:MAG: hypothetical protein QGG40_09260 [Myxococcota bacterium]|nr:hypothetical protein [Myxococcota bacterium]
MFTSLFHSLSNGPRAALLGAGILAGFSFGGPAAAAPVDALANEQTCEGLTPDLCQGLAQERWLVRENTATPCVLDARTLHVEEMAAGGDGTILRPLGSVEEALELGSSRHSCQVRIHLRGPLDSAEVVADRPTLIFAEDLYHAFMVGRIETGAPADWNAGESIMLVDAATGRTLRGGAVPGTARAAGGTVSLTTSGLTPGLIR